MIGWTKITKKQFYAEGGFKNPNLCRRGSYHFWQYYRRDQ